MNTKMLERLYRYALRDGDIGGMVIAENLESAIDKILLKYTNYNREELIVWAFKYDEFFDPMNPNVIEWYGV